jgi:PBP1b-binding outer membrane lipoprotein LpoB
MTSPLYLLTAVLFLSGCSDSMEPAVTETPEEQGVFDPMTDQLEKAKKVEAAAMQRKDDIDKALESADAAPAGDRK